MPTGEHSYEPPEKLEWAAPPEKQPRKGSKWDPIAKELKAHPGRWACIGRDISTSMVTSVRQGKLRCFQPAGSFEARTVNHTNRFQADIFIRYVGAHQEYA